MQQRRANSYITLQILLARAIVASNNRMHRMPNTNRNIYKPITISNNGSSECHWILCGGICLDWIVLWPNTERTLAFADLLSFARIFAHVFRFPSFSHAFGRPRASIEANHLFWLTWIGFSVSICHFSSCVISGCHRGVRDMHHTSPICFYLPHVASSLLFKNDRVPSSRPYSHSTACLFCYQNTNCALCTQFIRMNTIGATIIIDGERKTDLRFFSSSSVPFVQWENTESSINCRHMLSTVGKKWKFLIENYAEEENK